MDGRRPGAQYEPQRREGISPGVRLGSLGLLACSYHPDG